MSSQAVLPRPSLSFAYIIGDGVGQDYAAALPILMERLPINFEPVMIEQFRLPNGELDPTITQLLKKFKFIMKGPLRTQEARGARSVNVAIRQALDLHANIRPVKWIPGVNTPIKRPELLDVVIFRQNTEDSYMGIEKPAGSREATSMIQFLINEWHVAPGAFAGRFQEIGLGVKITSKINTERIMHAALMYAKKHGRKKIGIAHKGNIMKCTEGAFKEWGLEYAKTAFRDDVYCIDEIEQFSPEERETRIFIDVVTADDCFAQMLINPTRFDIIVTMNLNGDYLSDAAAAQVGGVPLAPGANIGDNYAMFEAIGGTADRIAGKNLANPTAFFLSFAMMLEHAGFDPEANAIRGAIRDLYAEGIGTRDMGFNLVFTTTDFAREVAIQAEALLSVPA